MEFRIKFTLFLFFCNILSVSVIAEARSKQSKRSMLDNDESPTEVNPNCKTLNFGGIVIPCTYNKLELPSYNRSSLPAKGLGTYTDILKKFRIDVGVLIRGIGNVDELEEEITVEMDFTAIWNDRVLLGENYHLFLTLENKTDEELAEALQALDPAFLNSIWKPDLFIENVVNIQRPAIIVKPIKVLFHPLGTVIFSTRLTATIDCKMEFYYYPADTQKCDFRIRSYSHTVKELELVWRNPFGVYISDRDEHNFDIQVHNVTRTNVTEAEGLIFPKYSETYDILQFTILARRSLSYHMVQTYLPSMFFIVITWLCFLIPVSMVEARIGVAMTTLLTLTSMFASVRESTPVVSYIKAIDIWMVSCIFFVFSTLLEFTILVFMRHNDEDEDEDEKESLHSAIATANHHELDNNISRPVEETTTHKENVKAEDSFFVRLRNLRKRKTKLSSRTRRERKKTANWIEQYAFLLFFITFLGFNLIYWPWLLISSNYFEWHVDPRYNADAD